VTVSCFRLEFSNSTAALLGVVMDSKHCKSEICSFAEFRRKVQELELLSAATLSLLHQLKFTGRVTVVVQNGTVLKSGYEEGYFSRKKEKRLT
jgi:seryl-tRNA synthetase